MEKISEAEPQDEHQTAARPTHQLEDVKIGDSGVQLLLSTKDHVYNAKTVQAGNESWQIIGAWGEPSIQELAKMLSSREPIARRQSAGSTTSRFTYGTGQKLGATEEGQR